MGQPGSAPGGQSGTPGQPGGMTGGDQGGMVGRSGPSNPDSRDALQKFVEKAAIANMAEIQFSQLAQQKAQDPEVKQFAQEIADQHTKAQSDLQQAASTQGISLPSSLDSKHQKIQDRLSNLSGPDFDRAYIKAMVKSHDDSRRLLEKRAGKANASSSYDSSGGEGTSGTSGTSGATGTSGAGTSGVAGSSGSAGSAAESGSAEGVSSSPRSIDSWASATLPEVEHHLQVARDLEKRLNRGGKSSGNDKDKDKDKK